MRPLRKAILELEEQISEMAEKIDVLEESNADLWKNIEFLMGQKNAKRFDLIGSWLEARLKNGPVPVDEILWDGVERGFSKGYVRQVKAKMEIELLRKDRKWFWQLSTSKTAS